MSVLALRASAAELPLTDDLSRYEEDPVQLRRDVAIDAAVDEYDRRTAAGEFIAPHDFVDQFPADVRAELLWALETHHLLRDPRYTADDTNLQWPSVGATVTGLQVKRELGRGGFGRVYLVWDKDTNRHDVLKMTVGGTEAQLAGPLDHPHIVPIFGAATLPDRVSCIRMPLLGCATLAHVVADAFPAPGAAPPATGEVFCAAGRQRAQRDGIPAPQAPANPDTRSYFDAALAVATQLAHGVAFLHGRGIRHRDLKPSNVLMDWDGRPVILDFNLAEQAAANRPRRGGTAPYMAPEQIQTVQGTEPVGPYDEKADVYALGVILYEMFSGQHPFGTPGGQKRTMAVRTDSSAYTAWLVGQQRSGCPSLAELVPGLDPGLVGLVQQCMAFDPRQRPTAAAVAATLDRLARWPHALRTRLRRYRLAIAAAVLVVAVSLGVAATRDREPWADEMLAKAKVSLNAGRPQKAEDLLDEVVRREQANRQTYFVRGVARMKQGQFGSAASDLEKAYGLEADAKIAACLAYCYGREGAHKSAVYWADEADKLGDRSAALLTNRAFSRTVGASLDKSLLRKELALALQDVDAALRAEPDLYEAYYVRGYVSVCRFNVDKQKADLDRAESDLVTAMSKGDGSPELYARAASVLATGTDHSPARVDRIFAYLNRAVDLGRKPQSFNGNIKYQFLRNDPRYQTIVARLPVATVVSERELVDPLRGPIE